MTYPKQCRSPGTFQADGRPYGSNHQKRCPKSSATHIGLRSRTLATIAERISHSHPAFIVAGATRIQHHCGTCGDHDATGFFCSTLPAHMSPPIPHRSSQFSRPPFSATHFLGHCFGLIPASGSFAASAFPVPPLPHWVPPIKQPLALEPEALAFVCPKKMGQEKGENSAMSYLIVSWNRSGKPYV